MERVWIWLLSSQIPWECECQCISFSSSLRKILEEEEDGWINVAIGYLESAITLYTTSTLRPIADFQWMEHIFKTQPFYMNPNFPTRAKCNKACKQKHWWIIVVQFLCSSSSSCYISGIWRIWGWKYSTLRKFASMLLAIARANSVFLFQEVDRALHPSIAAHHCSWLNTVQN